MRVWVSAFALLCGISSAAADPANYGRAIAFGDSLQDNGNLFALTLGTTPGAPYYNGRFSNGPTWIELLSNPAYSSNPAWSSMNAFYATGLTTGNVNAAVGGAGTVPGSSLNPVPSVQEQIQTYQFFGGNFGPNDLVSVQGGANDFFKFFTITPPGSVAAQLPGFAVTTANNDASNVALVANAGAKTILVSNLPNLGATPQFNGSTATAQAGQTASVFFNTQLNSDIQALAAARPTVNFVQMDWYSALNVILAKPQAFGFTNITDPCVGNPACNQTTAQGFLFWDSVHPSEAAQQLLARYAALLLSTEETGAAVRALGQIGLSNRLDASDIIFRRGAAPAADRPGGLYAEVIGSTASFNGVNTLTYGGTSYDYSLGGVRGGFDASSGPVSFGSSLAYQTGSLSGHALHADLATTQFDAYALTRFSAFFAGVEGGVSWSDYSKIQRATGFPTVTASGGTKGVDFSGDATVGAQYRLAGITLTPAARVGYASININSFTETAPILALQYGDQNIDTGFWTARLRASSPVFGMPQAVVWGEAGYEGLFATSDSYVAKLAFNTAHAVTIGDSVEARGFFIKAGIGGTVYSDIKLAGEYEVSTQNGTGDIQSGRIRVTIPLNGSN